MTPFSFTVHVDAAGDVELEWPIGAAQSFRYYDSVKLTKHGDHATIEVWKRSKKSVPTGWEYNPDVPSWGGNFALVACGGIPLTIDEDEDALYLRPVYGGEVARRFCDLEPSAGKKLYFGAKGAHRAVAVCGSRKFAPGSPWCFQFDAADLIESGRSSPALRWTIIGHHEATGLEWERSATADIEKPTPEKLESWFGKKEGITYRAEPIEEKKA